MSELFIDSSSIPKTKGVYFVLNPNYKKPEYFQIGTGGHFKGKNPNVSADELKLNWVDNSFVMYIGKAVSETNSAAEAIAEDRIVSIHQPHLRPIIRGKESANTEFGSKIHVPLVSGFTFTDYLSWDAFNEGRYLIFLVEQYKKDLIVLVLNLVALARQALLPLMLRCWNKYILQFFDRDAYRQIGGRAG